MQIIQAIRHVLGLSGEEYPMREQDMKAVLTKQLQKCISEKTAISKFTGAINDGTSVVEYEFVFVPQVPYGVCTFTRGTMRWQERLSVGRISDWIVRNQGYLDLLAQLRQMLTTDKTVFTPDLIKEEVTQ